MDDSRVFEERGVAERERPIVRSRFANRHLTRGCPRCAPLVGRTVHDENGHAPADGEHSDQRHVIVTGQEAGPHPEPEASRCVVPIVLDALPPDRQLDLPRRHAGNLMGVEGGRRGGSVGSSARVRTSLRVRDEEATARALLAAKDAPERPALLEGSTGRSRCSMSKISSSHRPPRRTPCRR